ncbi:hypothetical protein SPSYN_02677 [Sporotomaculum syntrophicum]|uniref:Uncharacterized protein n=1 Tax=Sporotomaculum syntrophicum TaxID=182264 RepID=A0A9D2WNQ5_9FIRM|nr:hypothetical protein [Sporotomaculum syntrophicum]KAF1084273.1 hypothetical protein SPSYN_02677 [Sporotomaculum syntrophicum]
MNNKFRYAAGQAIIGIAIFLLIYTYFFYNMYQPLPGLAESWGKALLLSLTAVLVGLLIELGRFWGQVLEVKINTDLLILQGWPAAVLSLVPEPLWLQAGAHTFPYIFFGDPVVTGISGVWLGVVLFRSIFTNKNVKEDVCNKKKE